jgi:hypothetical protein
MQSYAETESTANPKAQGSKERVAVNRVPGPDVTVAEICIKAQCQVESDEPKAGGVIV